MHKKTDLIGRKFGRLTVIARYESNEKYVYMWTCRCSCKDMNVVNVRQSNLLNGKTKSCSCIQKETAKKLKRNTVYITRDRIVRGWL